MTKEDEKLDDKIEELRWHEDNSHKFYNHNSVEIVGEAEKLKKK